MQGQEISELDVVSVDPIKTQQAFTIKKFSFCLMCNC